MEHFERTEPAVPAGLGGERLCRGVFTAVRHTKVSKHGKELCRPHLTSIDDIVLLGAIIASLSSRVTTMATQDRQMTCGPNGEIEISSAERGDDR